jgi:hypothetical protein
MNKTRTGKIARLPHLIREELNQRLRDNRPGPEICQWLNSLPEQQGKPPISLSNLSHWRHGGFRDYLAQQQAMLVLAHTLQSLLPENHPEIKPD